MNRRDVLGAMTIGAVAGLAPDGAFAAQAGADKPTPRKGRIKQGLWAVNFRTGGQQQQPAQRVAGAGGAAPAPAPVDYERLCQIARRVGAVGFDLLPESTWPLQRQYGLTPTLAGPGRMDFGLGLVHAEANDAQLAALQAQAKVCAAGGVKRFGLNAGQLRGLSYTEAANNCVALLNRLKETLEQQDVMLCLENVNDRRGTNAALARQDMAFSHWDWGMDVMARVNSPKVKILCDIYHLQIMDGDVVWRIRESIGSIGHFHVAGVPTRSEIDDTQELNFRYIVKQIAELPYDGYVSHEWTPAPGHDPEQAIAAAITLLDV